MHCSFQVGAVREVVSYGGRVKMVGVTACSWDEIYTVECGAQYLSRETLELCPTRYCF